MDSMTAVRVFESKDSGMVAEGKVFTGMSGETEAIVGGEQESWINGNGNFAVGRSERPGARPVCGGGFVRWPVTCSHK